MSETTRNRLLFIILAGGFATLFVEVRYMHREAVLEHWQAVVPVIFSLVAVVACLLALSAKKLPQLFATAVMGLGVFVGLFGTFMHTEGEISAFSKLLSVAVAHADDDDDEGEEDEGHEEEERPALAPISFTGLSAIGLVLLLSLPKRKDDD